MANHRDEFKDSIKRIMAERVAWRCSFPGCRLATIGPHTEEDKSTKLGEAAHITAAAPKGPRYNSRLSNDERKHISNGIWMCKHHARMVDVDEANFSENTLRQWKVLTERRAYEALEQGATPGNLSEPETLVALGLKTVFKGVWLSGMKGQWRFRCNSFYRGSPTQLRDEISRDEIKFVVVESQGDGRLLSGPIEWEDNEGNLVLIISVEERVPRQDPSKLGGDLALGQDGDLFVNNGSLGVVKGVDNAIQRISTSMGTMIGEVFHHPMSGSLAALYYHKFADNLETLGRLLKLDLARLATIPTDGTPPSLNTIWRVNNLIVASTQLEDQRLSIHVDLEWASGDQWSGDIRIYIHKNLDKLPSWAL